ncbi:MAG: hypothetical protein HY080_08895 [Gammaproteobacteria bacterium]|nr:hypothetical protein [Gammaproteobacteria bacterium]
MNEVKFPYKPNVVIMILSTVTMASIALGLGYIAKTNDRGLILNRVIEFSVEGATIFYGCLAVACGVLAIFGVIATIIGLTTKKEILLTRSSISAPKSAISKKILTIPFKDVTKINIQTVQKQKFLHIIHARGKLTIPQNMLPSKKLFEELTTLIASRIPG